MITAPHGTRARYADLNRKCRCARCVLANAEYRRTERRGLPLPPVDEIDDISVEAAMAGEAVWLNRAERRDAVRRLTDSRHSAAEIAKLLHLNPASITRIRARLRASGELKAAA